MSWDRDAELQDIKRRGLTGTNAVLAAMYVYHRDLELAGADYAMAKTDHERILARAVVKYRAAGERSATVAEQKALAEDEDVYFHRLAYRTAEQRVSANKAALNVLHAELEDYRTKAADARAANEFHARTGV